MKTQINDPQSIFFPNSSKLYNLQANLLFMARFRSIVFQVSSLSHLKFFFDYGSLGLGIIFVGLSSIVSSICKKLFSFGGDYKKHIGNIFNESLILVMLVITQNRRVSLPFFVFLDHENPHVDTKFMVLSLLVDEI